jgi:diaminopropionate ammonia-lyase
MLSCGVASAPALEILRRHDARSILVDEPELQSAVSVLRAAGGPATTPSGAAGFAGLVHAAARPELRAEHQLGNDSSVLVIVTEGPVPAQR